MTTTTTQTAHAKMHVPAPGKAKGLRGTALCGRTAHYLDGDHDRLLRLAQSAKASGEADHYCARCIARV